MIRFVGVTHFVGDKDLYQDLNWHIKPGERIGLVGDNGTGKTTLLRMAVGEVEPIQGKVQPRKNARIGFLRQEIHSAEGDTTVLQEVLKAYEEQAKDAELLYSLYEAIGETPEDELDELYERIHLLERHVRHHNAGEAEADARKILQGLGFEADQQDQPLSLFSGGWQMRAHIGRLLLENPDVLMMDEPTNHLDLESIDWLEKFLETYQGALIVVSHDRYFLDRVTTRTAWVHEKRLDTYVANYSNFLKQREEYEEMLMRRYQNQQEELAHHQKFIDRFRSKASKATLVQSRIKLVEKIELIELPQSARKVRLRIPEPAPVGRNVMELREVSKSYGDNHVFSGVNLRFEPGDKVALVGRNGAGKSTLLKICAGVLDHGGEVAAHPKARIEYFSQNRIDTLDLNNDVLTEARPAGAEQTDEQIRSLLGCFLFTGDEVFKPVRVLSGGEKSRLALARMMLRKGNLLLLDEPTNHLDISTREVLQTALRDFPGTVVMISHDRYFIDAVANRIVEVADHKVISHFGNYSEYLAKRVAGGHDEDALRGRATTEKSGGKKAAAGALESEEPSGAVAVAAAATEAVAPGNDSAAAEANPFSHLDRKARAQLRTQLYERFRALEQSIQKHEERLAEIHELQADPEAYVKGLVTPEVAAEAHGLESELPSLVQEWEEVGTQIEMLRQ